MFGSDCHVKNKKLNAIEEANIIELIFSFTSTISFSCCHCKFVKMLYSMTKKYNTQNDEKGRNPKMKPAPVKKKLCCIFEFT